MVRRDRFIEDFSLELKEHNAAIFAGAGLSAPAGFVDWKELLRPLASDINLDIDREYNLISLAQYHVNQHGGNRDDLSRVILDSFSRTTAQGTENHKILARLPISTYWTTNYDTLIENALSNTGKLPDVKHEVKQLPITIKGRDSVVYKMHGDVNHPADAVLCKEDYEIYHKDRSAFITALAGDLVSKTFLFLGFSFSDPNLDYILSRLRLEHGVNLRKHYCILKKESATGENDTDFEYRKAKQELFINDLLRYNIRTILVDEYHEITEILKDLEKTHKSKNVFVSGAAHEYGSRWSEKEALKFVQTLSANLIESGYRIVSGLGLGIGSAVVDGALQEIYHKKKGRLTDELILRPFPQSAEGKQLWTQYRNDMLDYAGVAIFMFGNKIDSASGKVIDSNGMREEFDIAVSKNIAVLPLGFTGYVAENLWNEVNSQLDTFYLNATDTFKKAFEQLNDKSLENVKYLSALSTALAELQSV